MSNESQRPAEPIELLPDWPEFGMLDGDPVRLADVATDFNAGCLAEPWRIWRVRVEVAPGKWERPWFQTHVPQPEGMYTEAEDLGWSEAVEDLASTLEEATALASRGVLTEEAIAALDVEAVRRGGWLRAALEQHREAVRELAAAQTTATKPHGES
jgi:hypothetical protein